MTTRNKKYSEVNHRIHSRSGLLNGEFVAQSHKVYSGLHVCALYTDGSKKVIGAQVLQSGMKKIVFKVQAAS